MKKNKKKDLKIKKSVKTTVLRTRFTYTFMGRGLKIGYLSD